MKAGMKRIIAGATLSGLQAVVILLLMIQILLPAVFGDKNHHRFKVPGSTEVDATAVGACPSHWFLVVLVQSRPSGQHLQVGAD